METKGNIGDEVYVKATIKMIQIAESVTSYFVQLEKDGDLIEVQEKDVKFEQKTKKKVEAAPADQEAPKRRPGRPKKATVEGTMKKYEEMMKSKEGE